MLERPRAKCEHPGQSYHESEVVERTGTGVAGKGGEEHLPQLSIFPPWTRSPWFKVFATAASELHLRLKLLKAATKNLFYLNFILICFSSVNFA